MVDFIWLIIAAVVFFIFLSLIFYRQGQLRDIANKYPEIDEKLTKLADLYDKISKKVGG